MLSRSFLAGAWSLLAASSHARGELQPKKYVPLPLGQIMPAGWLKDQIQVQTDGMAGHLHEFYNYVQDADWIGGSSSYSDLNEGGSYWFNGVVPHSVLANSDTLKAKAREFLDYVLDHQEEGGWLGPEAGNEKVRHLWGRYPFFFGATQMVEYDSSLTERVVGALHKFVKLANQMIQGGDGLEEWGQARWHEFAITLQWLHDYHPEGNEDLLIDTMQRLQMTGLSWGAIFAPENFPQGPVDDIEPPAGFGLAWHGVNVAEGFKSLPSQYRFTANDSDLEKASAAWDIVFQYHGRPSGIYAADEYLAGKEATRGTELCTVVETMISGSYLYQVVGDLKFLDRVERITYNALPAELTGDMWARQYDQQQNQIASKDMNPNPFDVNGGYSNVFGLEPWYPCCTVNHNQGYPKFISNSFMKTSDQASLVQTYFGPVDVKTTLADENVVSVAVDTFYPFSDAVSYDVKAAKAFTLYIRVPSWVVDGTWTINDQTNPISATNGLLSIEVSAGSSTFSLNLPAEITTEERPHGSIAFHRGPLHYALEITYNSTNLTNNAIAPDYQFDATSPWAYAVDPSTAEFKFAEPDGSLPSPIFQEGRPPVSITVSACRIEWALAGDTFVDVPPQNATCVGEEEKITLTPYGATKLRISEFPIINL